MTTASNVRVLAAVAGVDRRWPEPHRDVRELVLGAAEPISMRWRADSRIGGHRGGTGVAW